MTYEQRTHPVAGTWRAWLDDEAGAEASMLAVHLRECAACARAVEELRANRALARSGVSTLSLPDELTATAAAAAKARALAMARAALTDRSDHVSSDRIHSYAQEAVTPMETVVPPQSRLGRWRTAGAGVAAALVLTLAVGFTPQGQAAAASFLAQFRSQQFAVVTFDPNANRTALSSLGQLGTVKNDVRTRAQEVASVAEATRRVGFPVRQADPATLPASVGKTPKVSVVPGSEFRFTFDQARAQDYFTQIGRPEVALPAKFNGASLVVSTPNAALLHYPSAGGDAPGLMIGQARELVVTAEGGVTLEELRDFLLNLPGLPPETVRQLRAIQNWQNTLPIPVPAGQVSSQPISIGGGQGLILADNSGLGSGAIWQAGGQVYGVAGMLKADEITRVANSLR